MGRSLAAELERAETERKLAEARLATAVADARARAISTYGATASGYSHGGASRRQSWTKGYDSESLSARSDIEENRKLLRERSRDMAMLLPE